MVKLEKEVYNFLNKNIENFKDIKYLLGVSGGIDSMVLESEIFFIYYFVFYKYSLFLIVLLNILYYKNFSLTLQI
jgi:hypothetical protein